MIKHWLKDVVGEAVSYKPTSYKQHLAASPRAPRRRQVYMFGEVTIERMGDPSAFANPLDTSQVRVITEQVRELPE